MLAAPRHRLRDRLRDRLLTHIPEPFIASGFELWTAFMCALVGIPWLLGAAAPNSVREAMPEMLVRLWGLEFVLGGLAVVYGLLASKPRIEWYGLILGLGPACTAYGFAVIGYSAAQGAVAAALAIGCGVACFGRVLGIVRNANLTRDIQRATIEHAACQHADEQE